MEKAKNLMYWAVRLVAAVIMVQTLYYKFTAAEESVYIFTTVGMEPWGRIGVGVLELIASILILLNATAWLGAALALGLMAGAIVMHVTLLGIEVKGDGGQLFLYAIIVALTSVVILIFNKRTIANLLMKVLKKN
ncbi:MAG: DoxX family membrane protein [Cyclobacteriaceae bacterium]